MSPGTPPIADQRVGSPWLGQGLVLLVIGLCATWVTWLETIGQGQEPLAPSSRGESTSPGTQETKRAANPQEQEAGQSLSTSTLPGERHREAAITPVPPAADPALASLAGQVLVESGVWPDNLELRIRWEALQGEPYSSRMEVASDGSYLFEDLPPGNVWLEGFPARDAMPRLGPIRLAPGQRVEGLELWYGGRTLEGFVVGAHGEPVQGARVRTDARSWNGRRSKNLILISDANGYFRTDQAVQGQDDWICADLYDSEYRLVASSLPQALRLGEGQVRLTLAPSATLRGRVLDPIGQPVANAQVHCTWLQLKRSKQAKTDEQGSFEFEGIYPGELRLRAFAQELHLRPAPGEARDQRIPAPSQVRRLELTAGQSLMDVELVLQEPEASVGFRILPDPEDTSDPPRRSPFMVSISSRDPDAMRPNGSSYPDWWGAPQPVQSDGQPSSFESLRAGSYALFVAEFYGHYSSPTYVSKRIEFELAPGEHLALSITPERLQKVTLRGQVHLDEFLQPRSMSWIAKDYAPVEAGILSDGRFAVTLPRAGDYRVVQRLAQGTASALVEVDEEPPDWMDLKLFLDD